MNEPSAQSDPAPPPGSGRPPLRRAEDDRVLAGVAAGLARTLSLPVWMVRLGFVIVTLFGALGAFAYVLLWLFLPDDDGDVAIEQLTQRDEQWKIVAVVIGLVVLGIIAMDELSNGRIGFFAPLLLVGGGVAILVARNSASLGDSTRQPAVAGATQPATSGPAAGLAADPDGPAGTPPSAPPQPPPPTGRRLAAPGPPAARSTAPPPPGPPVGVSVGHRPPPPGAPVAQPIVEPPQPPPPRRPRPKPFLTPLTLLLLVAVVCGAIVLDATGTMDVQPGSVAAVVVIICGLSLLIGTWFGRARGLIVVGLLALPFAAAAASIDFPLHWSAGERVHEPTELAGVRSEYTHGFGQMVIDLRDVDFSNQDVEIVAEVSFGELRIAVPADVTLEAEATVSGGTATIRGDEPGSTVIQEGTSVELVATLAGVEGGGRLVLDAEVGFGEVVIDHDSARS